MKKKFAFVLLSLVLVASIYAQPAYSLDTYFLTLKVEDVNGNPLNEAYVRVTTKYGVDDFRSAFETTNESGLASFTLHSVEPSAQVRVYLKSVDVAYQVIPLENTTSPVVIRCDASNLEVLALDNNENPLQGAQVQLEWKTDIPWKLEAKTDENGSAVFPQLPYFDGYNVSIQWKNRQVYQGSCSLDAAHKMFTARCSVYQLVVYIQDKDGRPVSNAKVTVERDDEAKESGKTNTSGYVTFQLTHGNYSVQASYDGYSSETAVSLNQNTDVQLVLDATILRTLTLTVHAVWNNDVPAEGAAVTVMDFNGAIVVEGKTDSSGNFTVSILEGNYTVQVSTYGLSENRNVTLIDNTVVEFVFDSTYLPSVYVLNLRVKDAAGNPLSKANVRVTTKYGVDDLRSVFGTTDKSGAVSFTLRSAEPSAQVRVYWKSVDVAYQVVALKNTTLPVVISCNVSDLTVLAIDDNSEPLQGAHVQLNWKTDIPQVLEATSDKNGTVVLSQMPYFDRYNISIKWKGRQVYQGSCSLDAAHKMFTARCSVYQLVVYIQDKDGRPVLEAKVALERDDGAKESGKTNSSGYVAFQLTQGNYTVQVSYGKHSNSTTVSLSQNAEVQLTLNAVILRRFTLTVHAVWSDGTLAKGATVAVKRFNETTVVEGKTDSSGNFTVSILEGNYTVQVSADEFSENRNVTLIDNTVVEFVCDASLRHSSVLVSVVDENGSPASGVNVEVYRGSELVSRGTTKEGTVSFDLRSGTYKIVATYNGEQREAVVKVNHDIALTLDFTVHVDLMSVIYALAILSAIVSIPVVLYIVINRRRRRDPFRDLEKELSKLRQMRLEQYGSEKKPDDVSKD